MSFAAGSREHQFPDPGTAHLEITRCDLTLVLHGELDLSTRHVLTNASVELTNRSTAARKQTSAADTGARCLPPEAAEGTTAVIDAAGVEFIDAAGVGALVMVHHAFSRAGLTMRTIHAPNTLRRISAICELDDILGIQPGDSEPNHSGEIHASDRVPAIPTRWKSRPPMPDADGRATA